jgi:SAM-dependent methyltransferase
MSADTWSRGELYEPYIGRWSRLVAREFLTWLAVPPGGRWLDVGCGTGALSHIILAEAHPTSVLGIDPAAGYIAYAQEHTRDTRASFSVGAAQALPVENASFDAVVAGLALNFVPQPERAAAEMARAARRGGLVAAYVWNYAGKMELLRYFWDAAAALDPAARDLDQGRRFPLCQSEPLWRLFTQAGLQAVATRMIEVHTVFRDFDDYWSPFLGGQGPAPSYAMSRDEGQRAALRERIRSSLPIAADGSITLSAQAWAVRGQA